MQTVQKQALPVVIDNNNEPIAIVYFTSTRERVIYMLQKADEEEIIRLLAPTTVSIPKIDIAGAKLN